MVSKDFEPRPRQDFQVESLLVRPSYLSRLEGGQVRVDTQDLKTRTRPKPLQKHLKSTAVSMKIICRVFLRDQLAHWLRKSVKRGRNDQDPCPGYLILRLVGKELKMSLG